MQKANQSSKKDDETLSEGAARIADSAGEVVKETVDFAKEKVERVRDLTEEKAEEVVAWIKYRPITSVLIGAAVGYLLGRFSRR